MAGSLLQAMAALRRVDGGGSPEGPKRSGGAAQPLDAPTAARHLVSSPQAPGQTSIRQRDRTARRDHEHLRIDPEKTEQSGKSGQRSRQIIWEIRRQITCETTSALGGALACAIPLPPLAATAPATTVRGIREVDATAKGIVMPVELLDGQAGESPGATSRCRGKVPAEEAAIRCSGSGRPVAGNSEMVVDAATGPSVRNDEPHVPGGSVPHTKGSGRASSTTCSPLTCQRDHHRILFEESWRRWLLSLLL